MASLTPGVLSKLLENAGNKDVKVTGEYRHALLQVIEIVPCFSHGEEEPWQSKGYFLKLSDSLHSAYVVVPENDAELICGDKVQLGQFVYVTRLDSVTTSPVPVVQGLKPVPKRRPCVGNPTDLISSEVLHLGADSSFKKSRKGNKGNSSNSNSCSSKSVKKREEGVSRVKLKKVSPLKNNGDSGKVKVVEEGLEIRRLSLDSSRRVWDHSPVSKSGSATPTSRFKMKSISTSPNVIDKKVSLKVDSPLKSPTSTISPLKSINENLCPKVTNTPPSKSSKSPSGGNVPGQLVKVPLNFKTCGDMSASMEDLPPPISNLGKQVVTHRNVAFLAAVRALEEASAADTVIKCMCMFAEICHSYQTQSAGLLVEQFLELHQILQNAMKIFDSLVAPPPETKPSNHSTIQCLVEDECKVPSHKNAISWVQAAMVTNLSKFNLFKAQAKSESHYVVIENSCEEINTENPSAQNKQNRAHASLMPNSSSKRLPSSKRNLIVTKNKDTDKHDRRKDNELKDAATLAEKLLMASREWFLKYLEESLRNGFGLKCEEGSTEIACLLGQLKKVNHWLDNLVGGDKVDDRVENLRKSLYRFLLEHINSAVASS